MLYHPFLECPKCGGGFTVFADTVGDYSEVCADDGTPIESFLTVDASEFEDDEGEFDYDD